MRNNKFTFEVGLIFAVTTNTSMQIVCCSMELLTFHSSCGVEKNSLSIYMAGLLLMCKWKNLHFILKKYTSVVFVSSDMSLTTECFLRLVPQNHVLENVYFSCTQSQQFGLLANLKKKATLLSMVDN